MNFVQKHNLFQCLAECVGYAARTSYSENAELGFQTLESEAVLRVLSEKFYFHKAFYGEGIGVKIIGNICFRDLTLVKYRRNRRSDVEENRVARFDAFALFPLYFV